MAELNHLELQTKEVVDHSSNDQIIISGEIPHEAAHLLTPEALAFVSGLHRAFADKRKSLLELRENTQRGINSGILPDFSPQTKTIREKQWQVDPIPADLQKRRVEITGPVDRKMIINALNSGADVFMADFEDSCCPTWKNIILGQKNLFDAARRTIRHKKLGTAKVYRLNPNPATLMVRPRGLHLEEKHVHVDGEPISASLFDFGLYFFHNARELLQRNSGPYFYLPKLENHHEARFWKEVFVFAEKALNLSNGSIKATVLLENILAAFEMEEILFELKEHSAGLNCGRWDYIFSFIKKLQSQKAFILPNRNELTMDKSFLDAYAKLLVATCKKRGAQAIGGMSACIPIRNDKEKNDQAIARVIADKKRERALGYEGAWVAHPGLVPVVKEIFNEKDIGEKSTSQFPAITQQELLAVPTGLITEAGLRTNLRVSLTYIKEWLNGNGCVAINHLMEDAATAEISRAQIWQWIHREAVTDKGKKITSKYVDQLLEQEIEVLQEVLRTESLSDSRNDTLLRDASRLLQQLYQNERFEDFLTLPAYQILNHNDLT